jgi:hypothetical protein
LLGFNSFFICSCFFRCQHKHFILLSNLCLASSSDLYSSFFRNAWERDVKTTTKGRSLVIFIMSFRIVLRLFSYKINEGLSNFHDPKAIKRQSHVNFTRASLLYASCQKLIQMPCFICHCLSGSKSHQ